ncbi:MAG: hypothetical protein M3P24_09465 [Gemmatimonadota bacterium]|nr:hypothetical protein [Gemmatimonadota bacterium]
MKKKLSLLAAFAVINLGIGATNLFAGWEDDSCKEGSDVVACCSSCWIWCGCSM